MLFNMPYKDVTGQKIGKFTIISLHGTKGKNNTSVWNVRCECGNELTKSIGELRTGEKTNSSCRKCRTYPGGVSVGDKFGELTVVEEHEHNRYGIIWVVKCKCGNLIHRSAASLRRHRLYHGKKPRQMCLLCARENSGRAMMSSSRECVLNKSRARSSIDRLELDPFLDYTMISYDKFRLELMDDLEREICPLRGWLYENEIPGISADFDNETSNFPEYEDVKIDRSQCNIEEISEEEEEQMYKVLTDGSIETNDPQEAIKLSKLMRNEKPIQKASEKEELSSNEKVVVDFIENISGPFLCSAIAEKLGFDSFAMRVIFRSLHAKHVILKQDRHGNPALWTYNR